jgi:hypothetical protein
MLGHRDRHHRQLLDLMTRRLPDCHAIDLDEHVPAPTIQRPVLDDTVDRPRRQQRPALALVAGLRALLAPRPILAALGRRARRIAARRLRRVARGPPDPTLKLRDPLVLRATRFSKRAICSSIRNNTATTASRPWS